MSDAGAAWRHGAPLRRIGGLTDLAAQARSDVHPSVVWRQLDGPARVPAAAPAFMFGGAGAEAGRALFGRIDLPAAGCFAVQHAAVAAGGVIVRDGVAFHGEALGVTAETAGVVAARLNARAATTIQVGGPLVSLFAGDPLADAMPLLWVLAACGHALEGLQFLIPPEWPEPILDLLQLCGVQEGQFVRPPQPDSVVRAPRVIAPALLRAGDRFSPHMAAATRFWTGRMREPSGRLAGCALLVRDEAAEACAIANWPMVEDTALSAGFTAVQPASMTHGERAASFGGADRLLGMAGPALLEACLFAPAGAVVCGIAGHGTQHFRLVPLAHALGLRPALLFAAPDAYDGEAPAMIEAGAVRRCLRGMALAKEGFFLEKEPKTFTSPG